MRNTSKINGSQQAEAGKSRTAYLLSLCCRSFLEGEPSKGGMRSKASSCECHDKVKKTLLWSNTFNKSEGVLLQDKLMDDFWKERLAKVVPKVRVLAGCVVKKKITKYCSRASLLTDAREVLLQTRLLTKRCLNSLGFSWECHGNVKKHCTAASRCALFIVFYCVFASEVLFRLGDTNLTSFLAASAWQK